MSNPPNPLTLRLTTGTALFLSTLTSGLSLGFSTFLVPRLLEAPTQLMLKQWAHAYAAGHNIMPLTAATAAATYFWLAAKSPVAQTRGYLAAGLLTVGIVPYTLAFMMPTNRRLHAADKRFNGVEAKAKGEEEVGAEEAEGFKALVDWWGVLNLGRAVLLMAGSACGLATTL